MSTAAHASLAQEVARVCALGHLARTHLAAATGADASSARRWHNGTHTTTGRHASRVIELIALAERLVLVMDATYIPLWLIKPITRLDDRRPVDAIREGDNRSVSQVVAALEAMPIA